MPAPPTAVVLGLRQNGLGVVRALGRRGVETVAVDTSAPSADVHTRFAKFVVCDGFRDERLIETLLKLGRRFDQPGILIPTTDRSVDLISEFRERLEPHFVHSLPPADLVGKLMDKTTIAEYAVQEGFAIPRTHAVWNADDLEVAIERVGVPCIFKPQVKSEALRIAQVPKAFLIRSVDELRRVYRRIAPAEPRFVVQEWVPGPDTALVFCLYYFNSAGEPLASFVGRKVRQFIPYCGTACAAEPWQDDFARDAGIRFFQKCGYRGFGAIEFKRRDNGEYVLTEPTVGRTEHLFALAAANGVNLPFIGYRDMAGMPVAPAERTSVPVRYIDWKRDRRAAKVYIRAGELTVSGWLRSLRGRKQFALFAWDDLGPWRAESLHRLGAPVRVVRRLARRVLSAASLDRTPLHPRRRPVRRQQQSSEAHLEGALSWLMAAQDATGCDGVSRAYTVKTTGTRQRGWQRAYPETTGYIIPTFFDCAERLQRPELRERAVRMADWLLTVQTESGGIPGSVAGSDAPVVVFNTGMVLRGWVRAYRETNDSRYLAAIRRAADFLVEVQDPDGAWRRFTNADRTQYMHAYDVLVNWSLLEAAEIAGEERWRAAAVRNLDFTLSLQQPNGWLRSNALVIEFDHRPLTHTIGYAAQGFLECGLMLRDDRYVKAAEGIAEAVRRCLWPNGWLSGEFDANWREAASWSCLTGTAQMSIVWLTLWRTGAAESYLQAARRANAFLRARQNLRHQNPGIRGGIPGSHPLRGEYGQFQYLNWAAKFFADAHVQELYCVAQPARRDAAAVDSLPSGRAPERIHGL